MPNNWRCPNCRTYNDDTDSTCVACNSTQASTTRNPVQERSITLINADTVGKVTNVTGTVRVTGDLNL